MAETKITRISAKDDAPKKQAAVKAAKTTKKPKQERKSRRNPLMRALSSIGGYFKGAWIELRQVRWPTRRATWALTLAVIIFSVLFAVMILLLDMLFKYLFELIIT